MIPVKHMCDEDVMTCPKCGCENTHLCRTIVYGRAEDQATVKRTTYNQTGKSSSEPINSNPSSRRHATVLELSCEYGCLFDMSFVQHKGWTIVNQV